jgi:hypothetical protein
MTVCDARHRNQIAAIGILSLVVLTASAAARSEAAADQPAAPAQPPAWKEGPVQPGTYRHHHGTVATHTVDIPVKPNGGEIEYMVRMKHDDTIVYSWRALEIQDAGKLSSEFHGHTDRAPGTTGTLLFYRKATGASENGSLVAPFDGIHGWYLKNASDRPVTVRLTITGFYEVIPDQLPKADPGR